MTHRGISTVADVALCILLIGAGVATLSATSPPPDRSGVDPTPVATVLAASTNTTESPTTHHATIAERVAGAALENARTPGSGTAQPTTLDPINETINGLTGHTQVVAVWRPYPNAPIDGEVRVGESPPPTATVNTVRLTVPLTPTVPQNDAVATARNGGYPALAHRLATATLTRIRHPCTGTATIRTKRCTGGDPPLEAAAVDALTDRFLADLRTRYNTPTAAARAVLVDEVTLIVRRWHR